MVRFRRRSVASTLCNLADCGVRDKFEVLTYGTGATVAAIVSFIFLQLIIVNAARVP